MSRIRQGKQRRGYVPGDIAGNLMRAFWGVPTLDPNNLPRRISHDHLRQFVIVQCCKITKPCRQERFYTCAELVELAWQAGVLVRPQSQKRNNEGTDAVSSAHRHIRNICRELGIVLKRGQVGRPPVKRQIRKR